MTKDSITKIGSGSSYADFNGSRKVSVNNTEYTITTNQVMPQTPAKYTSSTIQFQAEKGYLTISGNFTKIEIVFVSTYAYGNTFNNVTVTAGGNELTATHKGSVETNIANGDYTYKIHTFEYTVTGGNQEIKIAKTNKGAANLASIKFTVAE